MNSTKNSVGRRSVAASNFAFLRRSSAPQEPLAFLLVLISLIASPSPLHANDISFQHEVQHSIDLGLNWLKSNQNPTNGSWSVADQPALTALALTAFMGEPSRNLQKNPTPEIQRGYAFIAADAHPDGAIYGKNLQNYNTALCTMALLAANNPEYKPLILRARQWLIGHQVDLSQSGDTNSPYHGGLGYGEHPDRSDMNNTFTALEAVYYSKQLSADQPLAAAKDLNWPAAIHFIQACQNKDGGMLYTPDRSPAGSVTNAEGHVGLRSYGSISYAGLLSYIYCNLTPQDDRVAAVFNYVSDNYTVDENPDMGQQGYYYYLHMMTKGLTAYGAENLKLKSGQTIDWRRQVAMKLLNLQKPDGSWSNPNNRWWEHDPTLVTSYSLLSLEMLYPKL